MKTKKTLCLILAAVTAVMLAATMLTGCNSPLSAQDAYGLLKDAIDLSLAGDMYGPSYDPDASETNGYIFAYKESVRSDDTIVNTNVNVHCEQDAAYNLLVNDDLMVDVYRETWSINSVTGGTGTKIGDFEFVVGPYPDADSDSERIYYTERPSDGNDGAYADRKLYGDMTAEEFIATEYFRGYSLASRLEELRNMPFDAFVFDKDVNPDYGAYRQINLVKLTFGVTDKYISDYAATTGNSSMFDGCTYAEIELTFGRVSNVYVYREENLGGGFFNLPQEMYSLQITYLGKNIAFPGGADKDFTFESDLLGRTDCAFAKVDG